MLVAGAMRGFPNHAALQTEACWFLDSCAALQPLHGTLEREQAVSLAVSAGSRRTQRTRSLRRFGKLEPCVDSRSVVMPAATA